MAIATINTPIYKDLLWPLGEVLNAMEERGILIDLDYLEQLRKELEEDREKLIDKLENELGPIQRKFDIVENDFKLKLNLNSPKQLLEALNGKGIIPKYKGKASVDKRGLRSMESTPLISQLLGFSELETLLSSFITPLLEQGRQSEAVIHPFFSQTATRTGRLACYRPNLQQIPTHTENGRKVKSAFIARPGYKFVELDYSAIEPRMLAHFSKSRALIELFKSGVNFHDFTAKRLGISRQAAKVLNLSTGYRATKYALAFQLKSSVEDAEKQLNDWWGLWPDLMLWENNLIAVTKQKGYIDTLLGRRIYIDSLDSNDQKIRNTAERRVIENLAQGSTSDLVGMAMIELHKNDLFIVNQIHDAVLLEVSEDTLEESIIKACNILEHIIELEVPLVCEVKIGSSWGTMVEYDLNK